ncbi:MAG: hypothetical protein C4530_20485 [Desulfobacteraceae bacterium]|nr:MAG: hypothetical protein C4530_20485 [Desulfobacteraceae bacterium]
MTITARFEMKSLKGFPRKRPRIVYDFISFAEFMPLRLIADHKRRKVTRNSGGGQEKNEP